MGKVSRDYILQNKNKKYRSVLSKKQTNRGISIANYVFSPSDLKRCGRSGTSLWRCDSPTSRLYLFCGIISSGRWGPQQCRRGSGEVEAGVPQEQHTHVWPLLCTLQNCPYSLNQLRVIFSLIFKESLYWNECGLLYAKLRRKKRGHCVGKYFLALHMPLNSTINLLVSWVLQIHPFFQKTRKQSRENSPNQITPLDLNSPELWRNSDLDDNFTAWLQLC